MRDDLAEILGILLAVVGCCTVVGAASFVSTGLAVLAAGLFLLFAGVIVIYVASTPKPAEPAEPKRGP